ncbi:winged helix-turn-helix transcriptional regulator|uniref:Transcriptional regulator, ArsR family n=1 Tax=Dendrosporobacter quercicolus TaxID=146817 RepID=A0A1G9NS14_9FIRM|nr:winged helix-turn-helix domain-containing protein [Dendrosporobacter quercicolus]NSL47423.1 winged helix-turn-helix transcriptional regulator [Dendrosporobacter quercicolus DSM 1736]SDL88807.1 transcriptional regulator, ArsR family [Dendrosporobacter quercicolus]
MKHKTFQTEANAACMKALDDVMDFEFYKVLFDPARIDIIKYLAFVDNASVKEVAENFTQDRSVISRHLELMHRYGIVDKEKQGRYTLYRLNCNYVINKFEITAKALKSLM